MQKTDYSVPDSTGILMTFKYDDVSLMDFNRFDELHDIGYGQHVLLGFAKKRQQRFAVGVDQVGELHFAFAGLVEGSVVHGTPNVGSMSLR